MSTKMVNQGCEPNLLDFRWTIDEVLQNVAMQNKMLFLNKNMNSENKQNLNLKKEQNK